MYLCIAPLLAGAMLLIIYAIHGVYPFGERSVSYYDMAQQYVPLYYHTWDVLHGLKNAFFDWNAGMGITTSDTAPNFLFFPINLVFLFIKRESILNFMSVFLLIKLMLMAFNMSLYADSRTGDRIKVVTAAILYTVNGYVLQYYTNLFFLDTVLLFPLLMLALDRLLKEGKKTGYILLFALMCLTNQQLLFMVVLYIIIKTRLIITNEPSVANKKPVSDLLISSLTGLMLSAVVFIPSLLSMFQSQRFANGQSDGLLVKMMTTVCDYQPQKEYMLYGGEIGLALVLIILAGKGRLIQKYKTSLIMILLLACPIVFENIDLLWHGGSYTHFPMRFGYMLSFELLNLYVSADEKDGLSERITNKKVRLLLMIAGVGLLILYVGLDTGLAGDFRTYGIRLLSVYEPALIIILCALLLYLIIRLCAGEKYAGWLCMGLALLQSMIGLYGLIAPTDMGNTECYDDYVKEAQALYDRISPASDLDRIKDADEAMNANYGFILSQSSLGCWANGVNAGMQDAMIQMGYSYNYTRVLDGGGTAFSDACLNVRRIYDKTGADEYLYEPDGDTENVYDCRYTLPFGLVLEDAEIDEYISPLDYQNALYGKLFPGDGVLFTEVTGENARLEWGTYDNWYVYDIYIPIEEASTLYLYREDEGSGDYYLAVNEQIQTIPYMNATDINLYPNNFVRGTVNLGSFENETVRLSIQTNMDNLNELHIAKMDIAALDSLVKEVNAAQSCEYENSSHGLRLNIDTDKAGTLFLPIGYSDSFEVTLDGEDTEAYPILGDAFIGLNIEAGEHEIFLNFIPGGLKAGGCLSLLGLLILAFLNLFKSAYEKLAMKCEGALAFIYRYAHLALMTCLYLLPLILWAAAMVLGQFDL